MNDTQECGLNLWPNELLNTELQNETGLPIDSHE
jgi:hypothetical protein